MIPCFLRHVVRAAARFALPAVGITAAALCRAAAGAPPDTVPSPAYPPQLDDPENLGKAGPGRWNPLKVPPGVAVDLSPERWEEIRKLQSIGYLGGSRAPVASGLTVHARERAQDGINFFSSGHGPVAILLDMEGNELHTWRYDFRDIWPDYPISPRHPNSEWWRRVALFENGDVVAIFEGLGILKLDKDSRLLWAHPIPAHHDLEILPDGSIWTLTRDAHVVPRISAEHPILEDFIARLEPDGTLCSRFSVLEALERSEFAGLLDERPRPYGDILHTNTLAILFEPRSDHPAFRAGNMLISLRAMNTLAVVDPEQRRVIWAHRGSFRSQHDFKLLPNGNILWFDNDGTPDASAVTEADPGTLEVRWEYRGTRRDPFFSATCGTAQRLPNGNTLITETENGRAFEVTPDKEIVWEYYNPRRSGPRGKYIAAISEMIRLPPDFPVHWARGEP